MQLPERLDVLVPQRPEHDRTQPGRHRVVGLRRGKVLIGGTHQIVDGRFRPAVEAARVRQARRQVRVAQADALDQVIAHGIEPGFELRRGVDAGGVQRLFVIDARQDLFGRDAVEPEAQRREVGAGITRGVGSDEVMLGHGREENGSKPILPDNNGGMTLSARRARG
ncbi:hypothetical protein CBM2599_P160012 [Cupriavidus taiwanensis]|nr:hypothetical protein CBM2599_P160012 [Cupriavidus taiwanensis]